MTSKEALKSLCNECEKSLANEKLRCPFRSILNDYCWEIEAIQKDLKVLEILKNYIDFYTCRDTDGQSCINIVIPESVKNYTIIKEWLENDKRIL